MQLTWRVDPAPVGRWRSFERRGWPTAYFPNGKIAASIHCESEYVPRNVKAGTHARLLIRVFHHNHPEAGNSWKIFKLVARPETLDEAKRLVAEFYKTHNEWIPTSPGW